MKRRVEALDRFGRQYLPHLAVEEFRKRLVSGKAIEISVGDQRQVHKFVNPLGQGQFATEAVRREVR